MSETKLNKEELKDFLDLKYQQFNTTSFIENDPVLIPHLFTKKEDIEIAGFLAATIAWGQRKTIINNAQKLIHWMDEAPFDFVKNAGAADFKPFNSFVHRTFNGVDCVYFMKSLQNIYLHHGGLEAAFSKGINARDETILNGISNFRSIFFELKHPSRTLKHVSDPLSGSSSKRLCMYLRWLVRKDEFGVDFGLWKKIKMSQLCMPLDVHTGNVSRQLGLLSRKQNDWKSVIELTNKLKEFDPFDPVKYDFALFGLGVSGEI